MLIVLVPLALVVAAAGVTWWLYDVFDAVPRRNADFGSF